MGFLMPTFLGLAALVGFLALMMRTGAKTYAEAADAAKKLPDTVKDAMTNPQATKAELDIAASTAYGAGYPKLADELATCAKKAPDRKVGFPSPWRDVSHTAWTRFVRIMAVSPASYESAKGYYGMFLFGVRRLVDLGIMKNPKKTATGWTADWAVPKAKFLADGALQAAALGRSMKSYRKLVIEKYGKAIGLPVAGKPATLSGLLAVAHFAGAAGLGKWITEPTSRKSETTAAYTRANGVF
jgi:hypothetical protein